jgi:hypothetical protein
MSIDPHILHDRHPDTVAIARYFTFEHLPDGDLRSVSSLCCTMAGDMIAWLPDGPELTTGLRKLLEAKDCFVRSALDIRHPEPANGEPTR